jgi:hypothetical protein
MLHQVAIALGLPGNALLAPRIRAPDEVKETETTVVTWDPNWQA